MQPLNTLCVQSNRLPNQPRLKCETFSSNLHSYFKKNGFLQDSCNLDNNRRVGEKLNTPSGERLLRFHQTCSTIKLPLYTASPAKNNNSCVKTITLSVFPVTSAITPTQER